MWSFAFFHLCVICITTYRFLHLPSWYAFVLYDALWVCWLNSDKPPGCAFLCSVCRMSSWCCESQLSYSCITVNYCFSSSVEVWDKVWDKECVILALNDLSKFFPLLQGLVLLQETHWRLLRLPECQSEHTQKGVSRFNPINERLNLISASNCYLPHIAVCACIWVVQQGYSQLSEGTSTSVAKGEDLRK